MRKVAAALAGIFLVLVLLAVSLPFLIDLSRYKSYFLPQIEAALGRRVDVASIRLSLFPFGARVKSVQIEDDPNFSNDHFFSSESVVVRVRILPLLRREVEVEELIFDGPQVRLVQNRNGIWNTSTLGKPKAPNAPAPGDEKPAPEKGGRLGIAAEKLKIKNGKITYIVQNGSQPVSSTVEDIDLTLASLGLGKTASFDLGAKLPQDKIATLKGKVGPLEMAARPRLVEFSGKVGRSDLQVNGGFQPQGRLALSANSDLIDLDELMLLIPQTGNAEPAKEPKQSKPSPPGSGASNSAMAVDFNVKRVRVKGIETTNLSGKFLKDRKGFSLRELAGEIWGGRFTGLGLLNIGDAAFPFSSAFTLEKVSLGKVIAQFVPVNPDLFSGAASLNLNLQGKGGNWGDLSKTLTGDGAWKVGQGEIKNLNLLKASLSQLNALGATQLSLPDKTEIADASGGLKIDAGRVDISNLLLKNPFFDLSGDGEVGLDRSYRVAGSMRLVEKVTQQVKNSPVGALIPTREGRAVIPIEITGSPQSIQLAVRQDALKEAAKGKLKEKLTDKLTNRLEKEGLGGFLKR